MYKLEDIRIVHLEPTERCQALCPMCDRTKNGNQTNPLLTMAELGLEDCQKIFSPKFIQQLTGMYMCGNYGDPIIAEQSLEIFEYFRKNSSKIHFSMNTNGGARNKAWWQNLAKIFDQKGFVIFSVDGLEDTNHIYRQNVNWSKVLESMQAFCNSGGKAHWDFIVFEHNQHQIEQARELAKKIGIYQFNIKKTARFFNTISNEPKQEHKFENKNGSFVLKKPSIDYQNSGLLDQAKLVEKYGSMDNYYDHAKIKCKVSAEKSLFVSAQGLVFPCCWTAGRMYKWQLKNHKSDQIWKIIETVGIENINAKNGLERVFESKIFETISDSWDKPSCQDGKLKVCATKCGIEFDAYTKQFE